MKVFKRVSCILIAILVLCTPVLHTYRAHALAVEASTLAAYAVFGTALAACGILIATSDVPVSEALAAGWDMTTSTIKNDIRNIKLVAGAAGGLFAHWTSEKWARFTRWVKDTFHIGAGNSIPIAAAVAGMASACLVQSTLNLADSPRIDYFERAAIADFSYSLNASAGTMLKLQWDTYGNIQGMLAASSSYLFRTGTSSLIARSMNGNYTGVSVFKPVICEGSLYIPLACGYNEAALTYGSQYDQCVAFSKWYFASGCGNSSYVGKQLTMVNGVLKAGNTVIPGTWASVADYISACMDAGVVIGIPLSNGTTVTQDDVVRPAGDSLDVDVDVDADYFPDVGSSAAETDLPDGIGYDIPIPITQDYTGQDVIVKDVTDTLPIDIPRIGDLSPADARPRVRTDTATTAANPYLTTARSIEIPSEIDDQTMPHPPSGGEGGEEQNDDDANDFKLPALLFTKFPFCLPSDFKFAFYSLRADPKAPCFDFHLKLDALNMDYIIPVDFSSFEGLAYFVRWVLSVFWVIMLILLTIKFIKI